MTVAGISSLTSSAHERTSWPHQNSGRVEADGVSFLQDNRKHLSVSVSISIHPARIEFDSVRSYEQYSTSKRCNKSTS